MDLKSFLFAVEERSYARRSESLATLFFLSPYEEAARCESYTYRRTLL